TTPIGVTKEDTELDESNEADDDLDASQEDDSLEDAEEMQQQSPNRPGDGKLIDQLLCELFDHYKLADTFWFKLSDSDQFAEATLEPLFADEDLFESVTDKIQELYTDQDLI